MSIRHGGQRFVFTQAGAGGDEVEDFDDLGAQAAGEAGIPAERVLTGDAALLVGGSAQRQPRGTEQAVVGVHAVTGGEHVSRLVRIASSTTMAPLTPSCGAGIGGQFGVGPDSDDDEHQVDGAGDGFAVMFGCRRSAHPLSARLIAVTAVLVRTSTPWRSSSVWTRAPSSGSTVGSTSGRASIWVTCMPRGVRASAISRPM